MTEGDKARLIAWSNEMRAVHHRLRRALQATRDAAADDRDRTRAGRDLLLFCRGFCSALTGHHQGEDRLLFPAIAEAHPDLTDALGRLEQDHSMIGYLMTGLESALDSSAEPRVIDRHLEGIEAIMESHFRYEERVLLGVLERLELDADPVEVFGPL